VPPRVLFFSFFVDRTPGSSDAKHCAGLALLCVLDSTEVRGRRADAEVPGEFCERGAWVSRSSRALTIVASAPATAHSSFDVGSAEGHIRTCPGACRLRFLFDLSRTDRCVSCAHVVCRTPSLIVRLWIIWGNARGPRCRVSRGRCRGVDRTSGRDGYPLCALLSLVCNYMLSFSRERVSLSRRDSITHYDSGVVISVFRFAGLFLLYSIDMEMDSFLDARAPDRDRPPRRARVRPPGLRPRSSPRPAALSSLVRLSRPSPRRQLGSPGRSHPTGTDMGA
jgi:hypothetical protein